jgi:hypothetical protein
VRAASSKGERVDAGRTIVGTLAVAVVAGLAALFALILVLESDAR